MTYASKTTVSQDRTLSQVMTLLREHGAEKFGFVEHTVGKEGQPNVEVGFELNGLRIRYTVPMPEVEAYDLTPTGRFRRTEGQKRALYKQAVAARWRAVHLLIRAKLEAVALGVLTFEEAFLSETILPNGQTMAEWSLPSLRRALPTGEMPKLLEPAPV